MSYLSQVCDLMSQYVFVCRDNFDCFNCGRGFIIPSKNKNTARNRLKKKTNELISISPRQKQRKIIHKETNTKVDVITKKDNCVRKIQNVNNNIVDIDDDDDMGEYPKMEYIER